MIHEHLDDGGKHYLVSRQFGLAVLERIHTQQLCFFCTSPRSSSRAEALARPHEQPVNDTSTSQALAICHRHGNLPQSLTTPN